MAPTGGYNQALAGARRTRRLTQAQLAERVSARLGIDPPVDGNYISKLERGVHTWPNSDYRRAFREELGAEADAELGFHCSRSSVDRIGAESADVMGGAAIDQDAGVPGDTAMSAALRWLLLPASGVVSQSGGNAHVRQADVTRLRSARSQLKRLDDTLGGGAAYPMAQVYLANEAAPLLYGSYSSRVGVDLLATTAELHLDLGWMAYDAGRQAQARRHMLNSLWLSQTAHGRSAFGGRVLTALSHQALHLGRPNEGLDLARVAQAGTSGLASPAVTAMYAAMEACALAATGNQRECESTLAAAETALGRSTDNTDPSWLDFDEGGLWGHAARAYRDLGKPHRAKKFAEDAIRSCRPDHDRTRAQRNAILASALAQLGEFEEAADVGTRVVVSAWRLRSCHVLHDVSMLLSLVGSGSGSSNFVEQAHELLATGSGSCSPGSFTG